MKRVCPACEKVCEIALVHAPETIEVNGEPIEVDAEFFRCTECDTDFENTRGPDSLAQAYRKYQRRHEKL
jgi:hypothetical protein